MLYFQRSFSFGAVRSGDEMHPSADTNVVGIAKYLMINSCVPRSRVLLLTYICSLRIRQMSTLILPVSVRGVHYYLSYP